MKLATFATIIFLFAASSRSFGQNQFCMYTHTGCYSAEERLKDLDPKNFDVCPDILQKATGVREIDCDQDTMGPGAKNYKVTCCTQNVRVKTNRGRGRGATVVLTNTPGRNN